MNLEQSISEAYVLLGRLAFARHKSIDITHPGHGCLDGCEACVLDDWMKRHKDIHRNYRAHQHEEEGQTKTSQAFGVKGRASRWCDANYLKVAQEEFPVGKEVLVSLGNRTWRPGIVTTPCDDKSDLVHVSTKEVGVVVMSAFRLKFPKKKA